MLQKILNFVYQRGGYHPCGFFLLHKNAKKQNKTKQKQKQKQNKKN